MTDDALKNAEAHRNQLLNRRAELEAEMGAVDERIERAERFIAEWHEFAYGAPVDSVNSPKQSASAAADTSLKRATGNSSKEKVAEAAREVILESGAPLMRDELYGRLIERGLTIQGKDPHMVLSTMLWRMKEKIVRVDGGGYWPADVLNRAIGHDPDYFADVEKEAEELVMAMGEDAEAQGLM